MFGGTDGNDNFGDLWVLKTQNKQMQWERIIAGILISIYFIVRLSID